MTTLLFDPIEKAIYSDSLTTVGNNTYSDDMVKIRQSRINGLGHCLVGCSGDVESVYIALDYLSGKSGLKPEVDTVSLIILDKKGNSYEVNDSNLIPRLVNDKPIYQGSGWLVVNAAYKACNHPVKAMSVAKALDVYSGGNTLKARYVNGMAVYEYFD